MIHKTLTEPGIVRGETARPPLRLLVIDDDADDRLLFGLCLRGVPAGADVATDYVSTAAEAQHRLARAEYDIIAIDHRLARDGPSGFDLLLDLRAQGVETPVILLTAVGGEQFAAEVMKVRATDYLSKPGLTAETLDRAIRYCRTIAERDRATRTAEAALRRSEERFRALVENSSDSVALVDREGVVQYVSRSIERVLGYTAHEFTGLSLFTLVHPADVPQVAALFADILRAPHTPITAMMRVRHKDRTWRDIEGTGENHFDVAAVGAIVANFRDMTGARETDRALKESERQFCAVFETALDAVIVLDDAGAYLDVNAAACELFGVPRTGLIGRLASDFRPEGLSPDDARRLWDSFKATPSAMNNGRISRSDGSQREVEFAWRANFLPGRHVAILRDVTERKRLEHQLLQSQKMETVGRLAGGIAHDFNNLLTAILGYCNLLLEQTTSEHTRLDLHEIRLAGERAASLTRQLLAFSRKQVLKPRVVDLNSLVQRVEGMLGRVLGEDIALSVVRPALDGCVKVDPVQIEQVILNLAVNARDAMLDGGTLTIETSRVQIDQAFADHHPPMTAGPHVLLRVSDTGVGMTPEVQAHIFEPFFTTKGRGKGTGLGLAMVYGIVQQSGGSIWVSSEPNHGTTFRIHLPITDEPVSGERPREQASAGGRETVLLVEDEAMVRSLVRRVLKSQGYRVLEASNGRDACTLAGEFTDTIDLLLTDVVMPGMSGRELVSHLRPLRPAMKVIYMSGYTDDTVERHGLLAPGVTFFPKPFTPISLANVVRQTLDTTST